jgi:hypothetical protein
VEEEAWGAHGPKTGRSAVVEEIFQPRLNPNALKIEVQTVTFSLYTTYICIASNGRMNVTSEPGRMKKGAAVA